MSAAAKILERARAADVRLEACGRRLAYDAPANVSPDLLARLRECKVELLEPLQHERRELSDLATDPKARTRCLSALISNLSPSRAPHHWPAATWPQFVADATDVAGVRYQIKGRRLTVHNNSRQLGALRDLPDQGFDFLAAVVFQEDYQVLKAALIPHARVVELAKRVECTNSWRFLLRDKSGRSRMCVT